MAVATVKGQMEFYEERIDYFGRAASLAWRIDGTDGFYLGGNADEELNSSHRYSLIISKFTTSNEDVTQNAVWKLNTPCTDTVLCDGNDGGTNMNFQFEEGRTKAGYIDHLHLCTRDGTNYIFGTSGHTNNHDGESSGKIPLIFAI